ncbi:MAG: hypothetical protein ACK53X_04580 [Holosporales bacterium]
MLNWLFDWLNKFLEDPSEEEKDFWGYFKKNAVLVNRIHFVPESKFPEFHREKFKKISETLERKGYIVLCLDGIYTTKEGDGILKRLHPSLPNTISVSGRTTAKLPADGRTTKKILNYGRITKKLPDNGRNTTKLN